VRVAIVLSILLIIFVAVASFGAKQDAKIADIVGLTSILEPSLSVDSFNSRFLKRSNDAPTIYPEVEKFNRMDIVYE